MSSAQDSGEILIKHDSFLSEVTFELKLVPENLYPPFIIVSSFYYIYAIKLRTDKTVLTKKKDFYEERRNCKKKKFCSGNQAPYGFVILQKQI